MRKARPGSLGRVLPIDLVEPDGLIVTSDRRYVRLIECERMPNAITADGGAQARIERSFAEICRGIPDRQALTIYAQTDPIPVNEALADDARRVEQACAHDRREGREDLAQVRGWLLSAQRQSVVHAAGSEQPAVAARWWVAVPHKPDDSASGTAFARRLLPEAPGRRGARTSARRPKACANQSRSRLSSQRSGSSRGRSTASRPWRACGSACIPPPASSRT